MWRPGSYISIALFFGLGLAIAKSITEKHSGEIQVVSRDGWTTFSVKLPISHLVAFFNAAFDVLRLLNLSFGNPFQNHRQAGFM